MPRVFQFKDKSLPLDRAHVMGILNVTPDSFSDGGQFQSTDSAVDQAQRMLDSGAAIIDIGGESTRPGAEPVSVTEEQDRVLPVVDRLASKTDAIISVDTSNPELMTEAAKLGAHLINDVRALQRPGALEAAARTGLPVCLMHMQGQPDTMQKSPSYENVVADIKQFLNERVEACEGVGIDHSKLILDPGFGFGKTLEHNLQLLRELRQFSENIPVLAGMSRKSMIGHVLNKDVGQRLSGTIATTAAAVLNGAFIIRVHDVEENVDAVRMMNAVNGQFDL